MKSRNGRRVGGMLRLAKALPGDGVGVDIVVVVGRDVVERIENVTSLILMQRLCL